MCNIYGRLNNAKIKCLKSHYICHFDKLGILAVTIIPAQKQNGSINCGLFSTAFAAYIVSEGPPSRSVFDLSQIWNHFLTCLENVKLSKVRHNPKQQRSSVGSQGGIGLKKH